MRAERIRLRSHGGVGLHNGRKLLSRHLRKWSVAGWVNTKRPSTEGRKVLSTTRWTWLELRLRPEVLSSRR